MVTSYFFTFPFMTTRFTTNITPNRIMDMFRDTSKSWTVKSFKFNRDFTEEEQDMHFPCKIVIRHEVCDRDIENIFLQSV